MPSYVLAAQEIAPTTITNVINQDSSTSITVHHYYNSNKNEAISSQRNLSLNLSPQYVDDQQSECQQEKQQIKYEQQLGQRVTRSNKQLKAPAIKSTTTDVKTKITTRKMLANVSNSLVGAIGSDDAYSERALLLRGAENVAGNGATQHLLHTNNTTTPTTYNNNQNSFHLRTIPKTTTIKTTHNNNNYGSTLIARNISNGGAGDQGDGGIDDVDYLQTADDDMLSDVAPTTNTETVAAAVNDNDEQKNNPYQTRQNVTTTTMQNANKKTKMSKLGSKNVGLKR